MTGPSVRLGILWFFVALAVVTAGRWPTALLWGCTAVIAGREVVIAWWSTLAGAASMPPPMVVIGTMVLSVSTPIAAALGTGFAGGILGLVVTALVVVGVAARSGAIDLTGSEAAAMATAVLLPTIPATAVVLVTAASVWAGIFLVAAVSFYDAGYHIGAAESSSLLEGPVTGIVGLAAVTFTMAIFQAPPFDTAAAAIVGCACAVACPLGQWVTSALLPDPDARRRAVGRLDAYVVAAPVFLAAVWAVT